MHDRNVSLGFALSAFVWFIGAGLVITGAAMPHDGLGADLGHLGLMVCCGGAVLMIRTLMCRATNHLERTVFELGREAGRRGAIPLQRDRV